MVLHLRYTARDGGAGFKTAVGNEIDDAVNELVTALNEQGLFQLISMKHEFGTAFHKLLNPAGTDEHKTTINLSKQHFPHLFQMKDINIQNVIVFVKLRDPSLYSDTDPLVLTISRAGGSEVNQSLITVGDELGGVAHAAYGQLSGTISDVEDWVFTVKETDVQNLPPVLRQTVTINGTSVERIKADEVEDFGILLQYEIWDEGFDEWRLKFQANKKNKMRLII